jgi:hypothetical protein
MATRITNRPIEADPGFKSSAPKKKIPMIQRKVPITHRLFECLQERGKVEHSDAVASTAQKVLSLRTPIRRLPCFTTYTEGHTSLIQKYFDPLMNPPQSVAPLLTPLRSFAKQLSVSDPEFTLFISAKGTKTPRGNCNPKKKRIILFHDPSMALSTTLLHELSHLAIDKLGLGRRGKRSFRDDVLQGAAEDIRVLSAKNWRSCDRAVKEQLCDKPFVGRKEKHWEEYLVRIPQIISEVARVCSKWSDVEIEARIIRDIPHLFNIYKKVFLPQLRAYVAKANSLCTSKKQPDTDKVIKELQGVLKQRMQPSMSAEEEALKDSRVVGLSFELPQAHPFAVVLKEEPIVGLGVEPPDAQSSMSAEEETLKDSRVVGLSFELPQAQPFAVVLKEEPSKPVEA